MSTHSAPGKPLPSHRLRRVLRRIVARRNAIIAGFGLVCLALGAWGFSRYPNLTQDSALNHLYQSFQLFLWSLWQGPADTQIPWQIELTRWLAPLVTASAVFSALGAVIERTLHGAEKRAISDISGHTIVVGLGTKGASAVDGLLAAGEQVVAVERNAQNPETDELRELGVPVVLGEGTDARILEEAGLSRARVVLVVCDSELTNMRVARAVRDHVSSTPGGRSLPLVLAVHVSDARLAHGITLSLAEAEPLIHVECVNARLSGLAMLLSAQPLPETPDSRAAVVGSGPLAAEFLVVAAKRVQSEHERATGRFTIVAPHAGAFIAELVNRYPGIENLLDLEASEVISICGASPDWSGALSDVIVNQAPTTAYVLCESDAEAVEATLLARRATVGAPQARTICILRDPSPYREMLEPDAVVHPLYGAMLDPEITLGGTVELLARAIHENYMRASGVSGAGSYLAERSWDALTEMQREANRDPAADIPRKLDTVGFGIVPVTEWCATAESFTPDERTVLAHMEHDRWMRFAQSAGYTWGAERVDSGPDMRHPDLVPWERLDPATQQKDYDTIDAIPLLLAMIGYRMERVAPRTRTDAEGIGAPSRDSGVRA